MREILLVIKITKSITYLMSNISIIIRKKATQACGSHRTQSTLLRLYPPQRKESLQNDPKWVQYGAMAHCALHPRREKCDESRRTQVADPTFREIPFGQISCRTLLEDSRRHYSRTVLDDTGRRHLCKIARMILHDTLRRHK